MKKFCIINILILFIIPIGINSAQTINTNIPEYFYNQGLSKTKVDSLYIAGWNECLDSMKLNRYYLKFFGLPQDYHLIYFEILREEFNINVIGVTGCIVESEEKILWTGFNDCIKSYTKEKLKKDIFNYALEIAKSSLPSLEILNKDSVLAQLEYPTEAKNNNISGTVVMIGLLDKDGKVKDIEILKGIGYGCDEEAIRLVKMFRFQPAEKTKYSRALGKINIPIKFSLEK